MVTWSARARPCSTRYSSSSSRSSWTCTQQTEQLLQLQTDYSEKKGVQNRDSNCFRHTYDLNSYRSSYATPQETRIKTFDSRSGTVGRSCFFCVAYPLDDGQQSSAGGHFLPGLAYCCCITKLYVYIFGHCRLTGGGEVPSSHLTSNYFCVSHSTRKQLQGTRFHWRPPNIPSLFLSSHF